MANDSNTLAKVSGYLEKKGKIRMVSSWKKYWFVLEGRLLLYYRSRAEYEAISPCKGSITLGPPCVIKPTLSSTCTFQIEARANPVTLRAESKVDYELWMKAILSALDQTPTSPTKMSHFRYSADDLAKTPTTNNKKQKAVFSRQNTLPDRINITPTKQSQKQIIERLQSLGAHSYGGSLQQINKIASKLSPNLPKNPNLQRLLKNSGSVQDVTFTSGDDTKHAVFDKTLNNEFIVNDNIGDIGAVVENNANGNSDSKPSFITENEHYATANIPEISINSESVDENSNEQINDNTKDVIEQTNDGNMEENDKKRYFLIENDTYIKSEDAKVEQRPKLEIIENENYISRTSTNNYYEIEELVINSDLHGGKEQGKDITQKSKENKLQISDIISMEKDKKPPSDSNIYQEISSSKDDMHSTELIKDNVYQEINAKAVRSIDGYGSESNLYSFPNNTDLNKNDISESPYAVSKLYDSIYSSTGQIYANTEKIYEEPALLEEQPVLPPRPKDKEETSSQSSLDAKPKKVTRFRKLARMMSDRKTERPKLKVSFVSRVFNKMRKSGSKDDPQETEDEPVYMETPEPVEIIDENVKMLNELQVILSNKKTAIEKEIEKRKASSTSEETNEIENAELIIETNPQADNSVVEDPIVIPENVEEKVLAKSPKLPPKQKLPHIILEYRIPPNSETIYIPRLKLAPNPNPRIRKPKNTPQQTVTTTPRTTTTNEINEEKLKTIDEILDDLDKEKTELEAKTKQKVKHLIEKFNVNRNCEEIVELRKKNVLLKQENVSTRDSVDLNLLLIELSKVTSAPILTPGVTSSLITTPLTNEEWLQLIPIRKRRLSEPDYDIPRPHSSLQYIRTEVDRENAIEPTRFFGPVLLDSEQYGDANESNNVSITPDSLEMEQMSSIKAQPPTGHSSFEEDRSIFSYTSHNYVKEMKTLDRKINKNNRLVNNRPRSLNACEHLTNHVDESNNNCDDFADSLEIFERKEDSTIF